MQTVTMDEAQSQLADLIEAAANGEPFLIADSGKPALRVIVEKISSSTSATPIDAGKPAHQVIQGNLNRPPMVFGSLQGQAVLPVDFDRFMEDEIAEMFGVND